MKNYRSQNKDDSSITETKDFAARIVDSGKGKRLQILSPDWYQTQINKFKTGDEVSIYISSRKPKRSQQQNRYYWGVYLPEIAKETGEQDIDALHTLFKGKFLSKGVVDILGEKVRKVGSTTELSKLEFSEYIANIEVLTGVMAPPVPNDYWD